MTDAEQVQQALAELWDIVKCRCNEAYTGRGLHDPDCECDSTDAVQTVANAIEALTKERDQNWDSFVHWRKEADDRCEQLAAARQDADEAEAYAEELEAKLAKAVEALTPSGDTKAEYMGEFSFSQTMIGEDGDDVTVKTYVPWDTIKEIMAAILARATLAEISSEAALNKGGSHE